MVAKISTGLSPSVSWDHRYASVKKTSLALTLVALSFFTNIGSSADEYYHFPDENSLGDCLSGQTPFNDPHFEYYDAAKPLAALTARRFAKMGRMKEGLLFGSYEVVKDLILGKDRLTGKTFPKHDVLEVGAETLPFLMAEALENCAISPFDLA